MYIYIYRVYDICRLIRTRSVFPFVFVIIDETTAAAAAATVVAKLTADVQMTGALLS